MGILLARKKDEKIMQDLHFIEKMAVGDKTIAVISFSSSFSFSYRRRLKRRGVRHMRGNYRQTFS